MKIVRLLLAVVAFSFTAACAGEVTAPTPTTSRPHYDGGTAQDTTTNWSGTTGSGN